MMEPRKYNINPIILDHILIIFIIKNTIVLHYVIYLIGGLMLLNTTFFTYCQFVIDLHIFFKWEKKKKGRRKR